MKLHKLTIHNLASIEDAVIDFDAEPLSGSDVFLICGNTGSGKSTILDAICLALYGRTPRLQRFPAQNTSKTGSETPFEERVKDARQLMRRGTGEAQVTLVFESRSHDIYTAVWEAHRSGRKADGNMQDDHRSLTVSFGETERTFRNKKEIEAEIDRAVGLDFEQFCRTTMLAQGEFTRFLISKDEEKSQILEKITGTEVYSELGRRVWQETALHRQEYEEANREVNSVLLLDNNKIAEIQSEIAQNDAKRRQTASLLADTDSRLRWLQTEKTLAAQHAEAEKMLLAAQAGTKAVDQSILACDQTLAALAPKRNVYSNVQTLVELLRTYYSGNQKIAKETAVIAATREKMAGELKLRGEKLLQQGSEAEKALAQAQAAVEETARQKVQAEALIAAKENEVTAATAQRDTKEAVYKAIKESVGDWAKALRADLKQGDTCPVCGQHIASHLPHEEELEQLFGKAKGEYESASARVRSLATELNNMRKTLGDNQVAVWRNMDKCRAALALVAGSRQALDAELAQCNETIHAAEALIASKREEVADAAAKVQQTLGDTRWQNDWRTATTAFVDEMRKEATEYNTTLEKKQQLTQHRRDAEIEAKGRLDGIAAQLSAHRQNRPTIFNFHTPHPPSRGDEGGCLAEGEDIAALHLLYKQLDETLRDIDRTQGAMHQQLDTDAANRRLLAGKTARRDTLLAVWRKWERLCNIIGDQTGKKFRNIAQSYVLANLIHSANTYMKTLSQRYSLRVIPETFIIAVDDTWGDGHARPVSTLSGGETFLTSLALALALSDIGSHLAVDTLFIDEGFGTLSGEPLQNAVSTLRSLHSQTGRHVGIISHIDELRERIPVQIQVIQEGINTASKLKIT